RHEWLLDIINGVNLAGVKDEILRERLCESDGSQSACCPGKYGMGPADIHRHDRPGFVVNRIAIDGFAVERDEEPWPQPRLLTVHIEPIVIAASEFGSPLQAAARNSLVIGR